VELAVMSLVLLTASGLLSLGRIDETKPPKFNSDHSVESVPIERVELSHFLGVAISSS
jgi:hypothetical protein